jgi:spore coat polysaccharide biosynthesis predicted glycosyltransferase SpsG
MTRANFLLDSGPSIGLGHLSRSLLLLDALQRRGTQCRLFCPDPVAAASFGRTADALPPRLSDLPKSELLVCDSYRLTPDDYRMLRSQAKLLAALDDLADRPLRVDAVINHNLYAKQLDYRRVTAAKLLVGPEFALVGDRVMEAARRRRTEAPGNAIVVTFGGTDDGTQAARVAVELLPRTDARVDVIVPASRVPAPAIRDLAQAQPHRVVLHHGPDVPALLAGARLYLGAAGMMSFEAFAIGLELITVPIAANQRPGAEALLAYGHDMLNEIDPVRLAEIAARRLASPARVLPAPIDGKGPDRLAAALLDGLGES